MFKYYIFFYIFYTLKLFDKFLLSLIIKISRKICALIKLAKKNKILEKFYCACFSQQNTRRWSILSNTFGGQAQAAAAGTAGGGGGSIHSITEPAGLPPHQG
jgi:hypothetical protein